MAVAHQMEDNLKNFGKKYNCATNTRFSLNFDFKLLKYFSVKGFLFFSLLRSFICLPASIVVCKAATLTSQAVGQKNRKTTHPQLSAIATSDDRRKTMAHYPSFFLLVCPIPVMVSAVTNEHRFAEDCWGEDNTVL